MFHRHISQQLYSRSWETHAFIIPCFQRRRQLTSPLGQCRLSRHSHGPRPRARPQGALSRSLRCGHSQLPPVAGSPVCITGVWARAAVTKHQELVTETTPCSRGGSGGWKANSKVLAGWLPSEARGPLGLQMAVLPSSTSSSCVCVLCPRSPFMRTLVILD